MEMAYRTCKFAYVYKVSHRIFRLSRLHIQEIFQITPALPLGLVAYFVSKFWFLTAFCPSGFRVGLSWFHETAHSRVWLIIIFFDLWLNL